MIKGKIKILVVEDEILDFQLLEHQINKILEDPYISHVSTFKQFKSSLENFIPDIIIADYKLNGFTGMDVLKYTQEYSPNTYFVFVTGTINDEEIAANTILNGASGFILKNNMLKIGEKLSPIFQKIIDNKKIVVLPKYKETLELIKGFIESANKSNEVHLENYKSMRESLEKFKKNMK